MNPPILTTSPPSAALPLLSSPFLIPSSSRRRRLKLSLPRASLDQPPAASPPHNSDVFGGPKELTGIQPFVKNLSPTVRLAASAVAVAGAVVAGYHLGLRLGGSRNAALGGAALLGAAGGAAAYAVRASVPDVAAADLHNYVASCDDPQAVKKEDIELIASKSVPLFVS